MRAALLVLAAWQALLGIFMAAAPGVFFERLGPFGLRNDHYIRDMASWELALAAVAFVAAARASWRVPVLALAAIHYVLHAVNHLVDVGDAVPRAAGPGTFVSVALGAVVLLWLWRRAARTP